MVQLPAVFDRRHQRLESVAVATWAILIGLSILLEYLFNSASPVGSGGMGPIPVFYIAALYLGWIPALIVGLWKFRSR